MFRRSLSVVRLSVIRKLPVALVALAVALIALWRPWRADRNTPTAQGMPTLRTWDGAIATTPQAAPTPAQVAPTPAQAAPIAVKAAPIEAEATAPALRPTKPAPQATTPAPQATTPAPLPTTDSAKIAAVLAFVGPTIPVANVPAQFKFYEDSFRVESAAQWAQFGPKWDAGNSISGYERAAIYYTWWARTGDTTYRSHAHATAVDYRDKYLIPAGYAASPHWSQMESLYLDWLVMGDAASRDAVLQVAERLTAFDAPIDDRNKNWLENRVQARVLLVWWLAEKIQGKSSKFSAYLDKDIPRVLAMQQPDGHWGFFSTCGLSHNYATGMLADFLTRIYDQRPGPYNPTILKSMTKLGDYLWSTQWRGNANPADKSFNYVSGECAGTGSPTSAPDLNGLMLPLFGWLGKTTGDATWFTRGDQVLAGMQNASVYLYRQFSESYSSSFRYFGYRWPANAKH